mmetsp:Transcript_81067/g.229570  ORF Transcript_81067/g.229570 Transcript_81067/m.229570 type:complete len:394 (-) Transcript_81067:959-2140(-)
MRDRHNVRVLREPAGHGAVELQRSVLSDVAGGLIQEEHQRPPQQHVPNGQPLLLARREARTPVLDAVQAQALLLLLRRPHGRRRGCRGRGRRRIAGLGAAGLRQQLLQPHLGQRRQQLLIAVDIPELWIGQGLTQGALLGQGRPLGHEEHLVRVVYRKPDTAILGVRPDAREGLEEHALPHAFGPGDQRALAAPQFQVDVLPYELAARQPDLADLGREPGRGLPGRGVLRPLRQARAAGSAVPHGPPGLGGLVLNVSDGRLEGQEPVGRRPPAGEWLVDAHEPVERARDVPDGPRELEEVAKGNVVVEVGRGQDEERDKPLGVAVRGSEKRQALRQHHLPPLHELDALKLLAQAFLLRGLGAVQRNALRLVSYVRCEVSEVSLVALPGKVEVD